MIRWVVFWPVGVVRVMVWVPGVRVAVVWPLWVLMVRVGQLHVTGPGKSVRRGSFFPWSGRSGSRRYLASREGERILRGEC